MLIKASTEALPAPAQLSCAPSRPALTACCSTWFTHQHPDPAIPLPPCPQVRTLPKVLKYLPSDKAQDARNFVNSLQYWLGGNTENLENFLLNLCTNYVPALKGVDFSTAEPQVFPDVGIWHPMAPGMYEDLKEYLNWYDTRKDMKFEENAPVIGLVLQKSHLVTGDEGHYSGVVADLESRGAKVGSAQRLAAAAAAAATWCCVVMRSAGLHAGTAQPGCFSCLLMHAEPPASCSEVPLMSWL